MNTDIRLSVSFKGHRKRRRLKLILGESATDYLIDLWISTAMNNPTGILEGLDEIDIALEAGWEKDPKTFVQALIDCKFLDTTPNGTYALHDWKEHQGWAIHAQERSAKAKMAATKRWSNTTSMKNDATSMKNDAQSNAPIPSPIPSPSPSPNPYPSKERASQEESVYAEKREQKKERHKTRIPDNFCVSDRVQEWARKHGHHHLEDHLDNFRLKAQARGYQYLDWDAAFMTAIREDWAGITKPPATQPTTRQSREDEKLDSIYKLTGGLAGRKNGERVHGNVIDITATATRLD